MEELLKRLELIAEQVKELKAENTLLNSNKNQKDKEINRLKQLVEIQNNTLKSMEQKLKIRRIADEITGNEASDSLRSREIKFKINEMIKEVDKVMSLIHQ